MIELSLISDENVPNPLEENKNDPEIKKKK